MALCFNAAAASRPRKFGEHEPLRTAARHASMQPRPHGRGNPSLTRSVPRSAMLQCSRGLTAAEICAGGRRVRAPDKLQCSRGLTAAEMVMLLQRRTWAFELQCSRGLTAAEIRWRSETRCGANRFNAAAASRPRKSPKERRHAGREFASMQPRPHGRGNGRAVLALFIGEGIRFNAAAASRPRKSPIRPRAAPAVRASMQPRPHGRGNGAARGAHAHHGICFNVAAASRPRK